jgi:hypothetical protein
MEESCFELKQIPRTRRRAYLADCALFLLPPQLRMVSLITRLPNRIASREVGVQMSIRRPRTALPVSATKYSPL